MRDSSSRPSSSTPSRWCADGPGQQPLKIALQVLRARIVRRDQRREDRDDDEERDEDEADDRARVAAQPATTRPTTARPARRLERDLDRFELGDDSSLPSRIRGLMSAYEMSTSRLTKTNDDRDEQDPALEHRVVAV